jgi:hypothetical protein
MAGIRRARFVRHNKDVKLHASSKRPGAGKLKVKRSMAGTSLEARERAKETLLKRWRPGS